MPGSTECRIGLPAATRPIRGDARRNEIMELAEARALVKDKTDKDITVRHLISVEG